jgi:hypothetical protein
MLMAANVSCHASPIGPAAQRSDGHAKIAWHDARFPRIAGVMQKYLTRKLRALAATLMVAAYAFGVLAPTVAFARADSAAVLHVLSEPHDGMLVLHFHDGDDEQDHHDHPAKPGSGQVHHCCGVVAVPGLEPGSAPAILPPVRTSTLLPLREQWLAGRGASRLERPPRSTLTA